MKIRKATNKDKKSVSELYYELHPIEEKENKEKGLLVPIERSRIKSILLVGQEQKQIVGFVWAHFIVYGFFKYGTIDEIFVRKEFRGQGIGRALIQKAMVELKKLGAKMVLAGAEKENKRVIKLYQRVGFRLGKKSSWFYWNPVSSKS